MSDETDEAHGAAARLMMRLVRFARGLGVDEATIQQIVERVITDMPLRSDEQRLARAHIWLLIASTLGRVRVPHP
jgi:hypothetical protein